jgi:hypothetical protein
MEVLVATLQMTLSAVRQLQEEELDIVGGLAGTFQVQEHTVAVYCGVYICPPPPAPSGCYGYQQVDSMNVVQTTVPD